MASRKLNAKLLLIVLGVLVALGIAVHVLHLIQVRRVAETLLARVNRLEASGDGESATDLLKRYLSFVPGDTRALARFGQRLDETARTVPERLRVAHIYEQVVQRDPGQKAIRRRLVDILMAIGETFTAWQHLELLIRANPDDSTLHGFLGQALEAEGDNEAAIASYEKARTLSPQNLDSAVRLANLLSRLDQVIRASKVIDSMVEANPQSAQACLERARYRVAHGTRLEAGDDLARARELACAAGHVQACAGEVLNASACWALDQGQAELARQFWEQGLKAAPRDPLLYLGLANLDLAQQRPAEAAAHLREGLKQTPEHPELLFLLVESQLQRGQVGEAEGTVRRLRQHADHSAAADYLDGRLLLKQGKWAEAIASLEKAAPQAGPVLGGAVQVCLALCYAGMDNPDLQLAAYQKAIELDSTSREGRLGLAATLLAQNRIDQALEQYAVLAALPRPPDSIWVNYALALSQHQLGLPRGKRDWAEVEKLVARAAAVKAETVAAAVLRAEVLLAREQPDQAATILEEALKERPGEVALWVARVRLARWMGQRDRAQDLLARARRQLGDRVDLLLEALASRERERPETPLRLSPDAERDLKELEARVGSHPAAERARVLVQVAEAAYRLGKPADGERLCRLSLQHPARLPDRVLLLDLVLQAGQEKVLQEVAEDLQRLEGPDGTWWRYAQASLWLFRLAAGKADALDEARRLLAEIKERRPEWSRAVLLQAQVDDLGGRKAEALDGYRRAFELGERQTALVRRLVQLLLVRGQDLAADAILSRYQQQGNLQGDLARLAVDVAVQIRSYDRALNLARQVMPVPGQEYRHHLWLGQILTAASRFPEAEDELREALRLEERTSEPWLALADLLVRTRRGTEAERVLADMPAHLVPADREVAVAVGQELLAHFDQAERLYRALLKKRPADGEVLLRAAQFFSRLNKGPEAEILVRRLLEPAGYVPEDTFPALRRKLALILVFGSEGSRCREALDLLNQNGKEGDEPLIDQRARALVEASRPERRQELLRTIEEIGKQLPPTAEEHYVLVRLYEAEKKAAAAREHMLSALEQDRHNPEYLAHHIRNLLDARQFAEAEPWVDRLAGIEPDSARVKAFQERLQQ